WIGALYEIDRDADGDVARVAELRAARAPAVLAAFKDWLWHQVLVDARKRGKIERVLVGH
ncbi:MAG TPA: hypothetical protein VFG69_03730, partial [Nannocystaceae bacterium]|nr:hypothetical protein [Nannocystaceae bacterium]